MHPNNLTDLQKLIEKLDGVLSAKLTAEEDGALCEIHVLADKSKGPKQLSRDIQSAVAAFTGENIEHRIISIAQIDDETISTHGRVRINGIETNSTPNAFSAIVTLSFDDNEYRGGANDINTVVSRRKAIANASLKAVHECIKKTPFSLSDIQKFHIAGVDEINVAVHYFCSGSGNLLTGTAVVADDEYSAVVKATLDAVNRVIPVKVG